jgi:hypothetical protein
MFNNEISQAHQNSINRIVNKHLSKARKSNNENAWQDCERKGMDQVTLYCHVNNLPMLGDHMINANIMLSGI